MNPQEILELMQDTPLTELERKVIELRYGFDDGKEHTYQSIADSLNVSRSRIRQNESKALSKLRKQARQISTCLEYAMQRHL